MDSPALRSPRPCRNARPDIVVLTESWTKGGDSQGARPAGPLGLPHLAVSGVPARRTRRRQSRQNAYC